MYLRAMALLLATAVAVAAGCERAAKLVGDLSSPNDKSSPNGAAGQPQQTPGTQQSPPTGTSAPPARAPGSATVQAFPVRLSQGIALEQTGPEGPIILFSATYRFVGAAPNPESRYALVIERPGASATGTPSTLQSEGTFQSLAEGVRERDGPFAAYLVEIAADGTRRVVSERVPLR